MMNESKILQSKNCTKDYQKKANRDQSSITKKSYILQKERLEKAILYTKEETINRIYDIWKNFLGKSGNRKLIKHDINLYKSIMFYGSKYDDYLKVKSFSVYLTLAGECKYNIGKEYFCKCGSRIVWDATIQKLKKKGYCKKCHITPNRKEHFIYTYGEDWKKYYNNYHQSPHMQKIYKEKGRKNIENKIKRGVDTFINKGLRETDILDYFEISKKCIIDRDFKVLSYFPDGYCHETNTIIEVYEDHHFTRSYLERDKKRQIDIQNELKCNFITIHDDRTKPISQLNIEKYEYTGK